VAAGALHRMHELAAEAPTAGATDGSTPRQHGRARAASHRSPAPPGPRRARGRVTGLAWRWPCAAAISWRITSPCFRSSAVTVIPRHCAVARIGAAYILDRAFGALQPPPPVAVP